MSRKLVYDIGINDADYVTKVMETISCVNGKQKQKLVWMCTFYQTWTDMLARGYSRKLKEKYPTYTDVTTCADWHLFSNFKQWMEEQPWEGMQLDKDILVKSGGSKEYNHDTCVFVPQRVNTLLVDCRAARGQYPLGVNYLQKPRDMVNERKKPYWALVCTGDGKQKYLGMFATPGEAHKAWQLAKAEVLEETINCWHKEDINSFRTDVAEALLVRVWQLRLSHTNGVETIEL